MLRTTLRKCYQCKPTPKQQDKIAEVLQAYTINIIYCLAQLLQVAEFLSNSLRKIIISSPKAPISIYRYLNTDTHIHAFMNKLFHYFENLTASIQRAVVPNAAIGGALLPLR